MPLTKKLYHTPRPRWSDRTLVHSLTYSTTHIEIHTYSFLIYKRQLKYYNHINSPTYSQHTHSFSPSLSLNHLQPQTTLFTHQHTHSFSHSLNHLQPHNLTHSFTCRHSSRAFHSLIKMPTYQIRQVYGISSHLFLRLVTVWDWKNLLFSKFVVLFYCLIFISFGAEL